jgi:hypothetical protein
MIHKHNGKSYGENNDLNSARDLNEEAIACSQAMDYNSFMTKR